MIEFSPPQIGDEEKYAAQRVLSSGRLTDGPEAARFENEFAEMHGGYAVAVSSATAGLHLLFMGEKKIIIPAMTHIATAHAAVAAGAQIRFADCGPDGNITDETVAAARAGGFEDAKVCALHYLGKRCEAEADFADSALHIGYRVQVPSVFSFYPGKHMTTAEGGMIVTPDHHQAARLRRLRAFGRIGLGDYNFPDHGLNYRMSEIHAAIGREQLLKLPRFLAARQANWLMLRAQIKCDVIDSMPGSAYAFAILLKTPMERSYMILHLYERGIKSSIHYDGAVPNQLYYRKGVNQSLFPEANRIGSCALCLPVGPHLAAADIMEIAAAVNSFKGGVIR